MVKLNAEVSASTWRRGRELEPRVSLGVLKFRVSATFARTILSFLLRL